MTKREEFERFKEMLVRKADRLAELPSPSKELDELLEEIERDKVTMKRLSREATLEWLEKK